MFLSASEDGTLKLWKATDGSALRSIPAHNGGALSARFTHDGRVVSCGRDNKVQIWDATGKNVRALAFSGDLPNRATFSDDGKKVIGSDWKGTVFVWDSRSGKALGELDANPPTMAERLEQGARRITTLQAEADKAAAGRTKLEAEAKAAQANLEKLKKSLAEANDIAKTVEAETKKRSEQPAREAGDRGIDASEKQVSEAGEAMTRLRSQIAALQKDLTHATQLAEAAAKKAAEASASFDASVEKLAAAKTAQTKWKAVQQTAPKTTRTRNVSLR
jgi:hypothetical protein